MAPRFKHSDYAASHGPRQSLGGLPSDLSVKYHEARDRDIRAFLEERNTVAYAMGQFAKAVRGERSAANWCRENDLLLRKANATTPNSVGGVLVPEIVAETIIVLQETYGVARSQAEPWLMTSDSETIPRSTAGFTTGFALENAIGNYTAANFDGVSLALKKILSLQKISSELFEDASDKLGKYLIAGFAQGFSKFEDDCFFNGDGGGFYAHIQGITPLLADANHTAGKVIAASGHNSFGTIDGTDIGNAIAALPRRALTNAKLFISVTGYGAGLTRLGRSAGLETAVAPDGSLVANWNGLPVVFTQSLPTSTGTLSGKCLLLVGDMRRAMAFGSRKDLSIETFDETFVDSDQVLVKARERFDIVPTDLGDNTAAGCLVGLFAS